jgi:hypothetical protein
MYNDCWHPRYQCDPDSLQCAGASLRIAFVRKLAEYKKVDALGKCGGGVNFPMDSPSTVHKVKARFAQRFGKAQAKKVKDNDLAHWWEGARYRDDVALPTYLDSKVVGLESYKFVVAFENSPAIGYFTEKMVDAVLAGAIPIYWGSSDLFKYLDEKSFVYCPFDQEALKQVTAYGNSHHVEIAMSNGERLIERAGEVLKRDLDRCVKQVQELDSDDELYGRMRRRPFLKDATLKNSAFDLDVYAARVRRALEAANSYLLENLTAA